MFFPVAQTFLCEIFFFFVEQVIEEQNCEVRQEFREGPSGTERYLLASCCSGGGFWSDIGDL